MARGRIEIDENLCKGCTLCTLVCPKSVIKMAEDHLTPRGYHPAVLVDPEQECTGCGICGVVCPDASITVFRLVSKEKPIPVSA